LGSRLLYIFSFNEIISNYYKTASMKQISVKTWIYFGVIFSFLLVLVFRNYFSLDEPNVLWAWRKGEALQWYKQYGIAEGRPVFCFLQIITIELVNALANLKYLRIVTIVLSFLFCRMIFLYLQKKGVSQTLAFIISILVFSLPGFAVFISWAECSMLVPSVMLSFYAGTLAVKVFANQLGEDKISKSKENLLVFSAIALQIVSLFNYQSLALAFVIPAFFLLILKPEMPSKKRFVFFVSIIVVFGISLGIYYELFKSLLNSSGVVMTPRGNVGFANLPWKLKWFSGVLYEATKLHFLLFKNLIVGNIFTLIIVVILIRDLIKMKFLDLFFLLSFCVLLFLPHLLIVDSWGASRNFLLISLILVFYMVTRIFEIIPTASNYAAAGIGLVFIAIMGFNIWEGWVKPMQKDYVVMNEFAGKLPAITTYTLIVEVTPPKFDMHEKQSVLKYYFDEFNAPLYSRIWPIEPGLKCLYGDIHPGISVDKISKLIKVYQDTVKLPAYELNLTKIPLNLNYQ